jgi:hypothetical protein
MMTLDLTPTATDNEVAWLSSTSIEENDKIQMSVAKLPNDVVKLMKLKESAEKASVGNKANKRGAEIVTEIVPCVKSHGFIFCVYGRLLMHTQLFQFW